MGDIWLVLNRVVEVSNWVLRLKNTKTLNEKHGFGDFPTFISRLIAEFFGKMFVFLKVVFPIRVSWHCSETLTQQLWRKLVTFCYLGSMLLAILCALFGMVMWPFQMVKWPPTIRGWKGHGLNHLAGIIFTVCFGIPFPWMTTGQTAPLKEVPFLERFARAKRAGFGAVEISSNELFEHPPQEVGGKTPPATTLR